MLFAIIRLVDNVISMKNNKMLNIARHLSKKASLPVTTK